MVFENERFLKLPIRRRGQFLKDDFFKDFLSDFDTTITDVMDRYAGKSLLADQFSNYRKLREKTPNTEPAVSVSETKDSTLIVLDMSDFTKGSITVRTQSFNAIVEANFESNSFCRKFPLPSSTNIDGVKVAMSDEGILTINAPKKELNIKELNRNRHQNLNSLKMNIGSFDILDESPRQVESESDSSSFTTEDERRSSLHSTSAAATDRLLTIYPKGKFFQDDYFKNVWNDFDKVLDDIVLRKRASREDVFQVEKDRSNIQKRDMVLEAERRQQEYIDKVLDRRSSESLGVPRFTRMNSYRNLCSWVPEEATQAINITKNENGYKITFDVKNWSTDPSDITVEASEGEIKVTGCKGTSIITKEFLLKGLTNPDQVDATMSEDGILTIRAKV